jgi:hypothetical protein
MIMILWPLLVAVLGLLVYFAAKTNAKVAEAGRILFACGTLWTVYVLLGRAFRLG